MGDLLGPACDGAPPRGPRSRCAAATDGTSGPARDGTRRDVVEVPLCHAGLVTYVMLAFCWLLVYNIGKLAERSTADKEDMMDEKNRVSINADGMLVVPCTTDDRTAVKFSIWNDGEVRIAHKDATGHISSVFITLEELEEVIIQLRPMRAVLAKVAAEVAYYEELERRDWAQAR